MSWGIRGAVLFVIYFSNFAIADIVRPSLGLTQVRVAKDSKGVLPAGDLIYENRLLTQLEALKLQESGTINLALLDPKTPSDVWIGQSTTADSKLDSEIEVSSGDLLNFEGELLSSSGNFKFVAQKGGQSYSLQISRTLHSQLLRKELLRTLGYRLPPSRWLKGVRIEFGNSLTRNEVLIQMIPKATTGAASRWCRALPELLAANPEIPCEKSRPEDGLKSENQIFFQDILVSPATPWIYNLVSPPIEGDEFDLVSPSRTLRALALVYALVNVPESLNQLTWYEGRLEGEEIKFVLPDLAQFNCTWEDALWILNRIKNLSKKDFEDIARRADFPENASILLAEKLSARRNSLLRLFEVQAEDLPVDPEIGGVPGLEKGRLTATEWPGFGSSFTYGEPESPLAHLQYLFFSILESNALDNLISEFNRQLPNLKVDETIKSYAEEMQQKAWNQQRTSGSPQKVEFGAWKAPYVHPGLDISRSVVFGNFMGTNQMIQLADTFGYGLESGLVFGTTGLPSNQKFSAMISGSTRVTYTHLRPVVDLKTAFKTPIKELFVKRLIHKIVSEELVKEAPSDEKATKEILKELKKNFGVGESLIISQSVRGTQGVSGAVGAFGTPGIPQLNLSARVQEIGLNRVHVTRRSESEILVYKDHGDLVGLNFSAAFVMGFPVSFPVAVFQANGVRGEAKTLLFKINLSENLEDNPEVLTRLKALRVLLVSGSTEFLETQEKPTKVRTQFVDKEASLRFLMFSHRSLKTSGRLEVTNPDQEKAEFLQLSRGVQSGKNYQALANDVIGFALDRLTKNGAGQISVPTSPNPGETMFGHSITREAELQARVDRGLEFPSVSVKYRWQGWNLKSVKALKLVQELNQKYGVRLFDDLFLQDTRTIRLYKLGLSLFIYSEGLESLLSPDPQVYKRVTKKYLEKFRCRFTPDSGNGSALHEESCQFLKKYMDRVELQARKPKQGEDKAKIYLDASFEAEKVFDLADIVELVGGIKRIHLSAQISGFREGSETLSQPLSSLESPGEPDEVYPQGVINFVQQSLGIQEGEFFSKWTRSTL